MLNIQWMDWWIQRTKFDWYLIFLITKRTSPIRYNGKITYKLTIGFLKTIKLVQFYWKSVKQLDYYQNCGTLSLPGQSFLYITLYSCTLSSLWFDCLATSNKNSQIHNWTQIHISWWIQLNFPSNRLIECNAKC